MGISKVKNNKADRNIKWKAFYAILIFIFSYFMTREYSVYKEESLFIEEKNLPIKSPINKVLREKVCKEKLFWSEKPLTRKWLHLFLNES